MIDPLYIAIQSIGFIGVGALLVYQIWDHVYDRDIIKANSKIKELEQAVENQGSEIIELIDINYQLEQKIADMESMHSGVYR